MRIILPVLASVALVAGSPATAQASARVVQTKLGSPSMDGNSVARDAPITAGHGWTC